MQRLCSMCSGVKFVHDSGELQLKIFLVGDMPETVLFSASCWVSAGYVGNKNITHHLGVKSLARCQDQPLTLYEYTATFWTLGTKPVILSLMYDFAEN